jgi:hypothetical protein
MTFVFNFAARPGGGGVALCILRGSYDFSAASAPTQQSTGLLISLIHLSLVILGCLGLVVEGRRPGQGRAAGQAAGVAQLAIGMNDQTDPPVRQGMAGG